MAEALRPLPTLTLTESLAAEPLPELTLQQKNEMLRKSLLERLGKLQAIANADGKSQAAQYRSPLDAMTIFLNNLKTEFSKESDPQVIATHLGIYANTLNTIESPIVDPEINLGAEVAAFRRRKEQVLADAKARLEPLRGRVDRDSGESLLTDMQRAGLQALGQIHLHYKKWDELIAKLETAEDEDAQAAIEAKIDTRVHLLTKLLDTVERAIPKEPTVTLPVKVNPAPTVLAEPIVSTTSGAESVSLPPVTHVTQEASQTPKSSVVEFPSHAQSSAEDQPAANEQPILDIERWGKVKRIAWQAVRSVVLAGFVLVNTADKQDDVSSISASGVALSDIYTPIPKTAAWVTEEVATPNPEIVAPVVIEQAEISTKPEQELPLDTIEEETTSVVTKQVEEVVFVTETMPEGQAPIASIESNDINLPSNSELVAEIATPHALTLKSRDEAVAPDITMAVSPMSETAKDTALSFGEGETRIEMVDTIAQGYRMETAFLTKANDLLADLPETSRTAIAIEVYQKIRTDSELQRSMGLDEGPDMYFIGDSINYTEPLRLVSGLAKPVREVYNSSENLLRATTPDTSVSYEAVPGPEEVTDASLQAEDTEVTTSYEGTEADLLVEVDKFLNNNIMIEAGQTVWQDAWGESKMLKLCRDMTVGDMTTIAVLQGDEYLEACRSFGVAPKDFSELYKQVIVAARDNQVMVAGQTLTREGAFASTIPVADVLKAVYLQLHYKK